MIMRSQMCVHHANADSIGIHSYAHCTFISLKTSKINRLLVEQQLLHACIRFLSWLFYHTNFSNRLMAARQRISLSYSHSTGLKNLSYNKKQMHVILALYCLLTHMPPKPVLVYWVSINLKCVKCFLRQKTFKTRPCNRCERTFT